MKKAKRTAERSAAEATSKSTIESTPQSSARPAHVHGQRGSLQQRWDAFWFAPRPAERLVVIQRLVSVIAIVWFVQQLTASGFWWSEPGFHTVKLASSMEAFTEGALAARFRLSPLWLTQSYTAIFVWCCAGMLLAGLSAFNYGGRATRVLSTLFVLCLAQRIGWCNGLAEPYLLALMAYLAFARMASAADWSHGFSLRLIQVHTWLLLCAALVSQLSFDAWRQGEAAWWLASSGRSNLLTPAVLEGRLLLVNLLTHSITISTLVAAVCLWPFVDSPSILRRRSGIAASLVLAASYALAADQLLYGGLLAAGTMAWHWKVKP